MFEARKVYDTKSGTYHEYQIIPVQGVDIRRNDEEERNYHDIHEASRFINGFRTDAQKFKDREYEDEYEDEDEYEYVDEEDEYDDIIPPPRVKSWQVDEALQRFKRGDRTPETLKTLHFDQAMADALDQAIHEQAVTSLVENAWKTDAMIYEKLEEDPEEFQPSGKRYEQAYKKSHNSLNARRNKNKGMTEKQRKAMMKSARKEHERKLREKSYIPPEFTY